MSENKERTVKALDIMQKELQVPRHVVAPILRNLLQAYESEWRHIEADGYRVLADAVFQHQENVAKKMAPGSSGRRAKRTRERAKPSREVKRKARQVESDESSDSGLESSQGNGGDENNSFPTAIASRIHNDSGKTMQNQQSLSSAAEAINVQQQATVFDPREAYPMRGSIPKVAGDRVRCAAIDSVVVQKPAVPQDQHIQGKSKELACMQCLKQAAGSTTGSGETPGKVKGQPLGQQFLPDVATTLGGDHFCGLTLKEKRRSLEDPALTGMFKKPKMELPDPCHMGIGPSQSDVVETPTYTSRSQPRLQAENSHPTVHPIRQINEPPETQGGMVGQPADEPSVPPQMVSSRQPCSSLSSQQVPASAEVQPPCTKIHPLTVVKAEPVCPEHLVSVSPGTQQGMVGQPHDQPSLPSGMFTSRRPNTSPSSHQVLTSEVVQPLCTTIAKDHPPTIVEAGPVFHKHPVSVWPEAQHGLVQSVDQPSFPSQVVDSRQPCSPLAGVKAEPVLHACPVSVSLETYHGRAESTDQPSLPSHVVSSRQHSASLFSPPVSASATVQHCALKAVKAEPFCQEHPVIEQSVGLFQMVNFREPSTSLSFQQVTVSAEVQPLCGPIASNPPPTSVKAEPGGHEHPVSVSPGTQQLIPGHPVDPPSWPSQMIISGQTSQQVSAQGQPLPTAINPPHTLVKAEPVSHEHLGTETPGTQEVVLGQAVVVKAEPVSHEHLGIVSPGTQQLMRGKAVEQPSLPSRLVDSGQTCSSLSSLQIQPLCVTFAQHYSLMKAESVSKEHPNEIVVSITVEPEEIKQLQTQRSKDGHFSDMARPQQAGIPLMTSTPRQQESSSQDKKESGISPAELGSRGLMKESMKASQKCDNALLALAMNYMELGELSTSATDLLSSDSGGCPDSTKAPEDGSASIAPESAALTGGRTDLNLHTGAGDSGLPCKRKTHMQVVDSSDIQSALDRAEGGGPKCSQKSGRPPRNGICSYRSTPSPSTSGSGENSKRRSTRKARSESGGALEAHRAMKEEQLDPELQKVDRHDSSDLSRGTEKIAISLVYTSTSGTLPSDFFYVSQNVLYQDAYVRFPLSRIGEDDCCIACVGNCLESEIPCACARQTGGEYAYTVEGCLQQKFIQQEVDRQMKPNLAYCRAGLCPERKKNELCKGHIHRRFLKECWDKCGCKKLCGNRVVQRGIGHRLQVFWTATGKGWGIRTLEDLPAGSFVCEYAGEILTNTELYLRNTNGGNAKHHFPVQLDADWGSESILKDEEALCLDATYYGNVARFINHRCFDANMLDMPVEIESPDHHYYHIIACRGTVHLASASIFTSRAVKANEELTWDYGIDFDDDGHPIKAFKCRCESSYCRGKGSK